jgi:hypothetical protein
VITLPCVTKNRDRGVGLDGDRTFGMQDMLQEQSWGDFCEYLGLVENSIVT